MGSRPGAGWGGVEPSAPPLPAQEGQRSGRLPSVVKSVPCSTAAEVRSPRGQGSLSGHRRVQSTPKVALGQELLPEGAEVAVNISSFLTKSPCSTDTGPVRRGPVVNACSHVFQSGGEVGAPLSFLNPPTTMGKRPWKTVRSAIAHPEGLRLGSSGRAGVRGHGGGAGAEGLSAGPPPALGEGAARRTALHRSCGCPRALPPCSPRSSGQ